VQAPVLIPKESFAPVVFQLSEFIGKYLFEKNFEPHHYCCCFAHNGCVEKSELVLKLALSRGWADARAPWCPPYTKRSTKRRKRGEDWIRNVPRLGETLPCSPTAQHSVLILIYNFLLVQNKINKLKKFSKFDQEFSCVLLI